MTNMSIKHPIVDEKFNKKSETLMIFQIKGLCLAKFQLIEPLVEVCLLFQH